MSNQSKTEEFSFLRGLFFPIHLFELKRFLPMAFMMLFILINYTILRNVKDTLVVNARGSDAEIISFLKLWGTMPCAVLFMLFYTKIADLLSREKIFYVCLFPFIIFFGIFPFLIYPNVEILHPDPALVSNLKMSFPNFKWFIAIWGNWTYSVFYILAELWGSVMLSLLFWQFANDIVKSDQTKRFYPLFGMIANIGLIFAGSAVKYFSKVQEGVSDPWQATLSCLMPTVVISGLIIAGLFYYLNRSIVDNEEKEEKTTKKKKPKLSIKESFTYLFSSPHLLCIALIVLGYGICINYVDVLWKGQAKLYFAGDKNAFADFMGSFAITTGLIAIPIMLVGGNILRRISWLKSALITPLTFLVMGFAFFAAVIAGSIYGDLNATLFTLGGASVSFLGIAVYFGLFQNAFTKATKYSLFDPTKEMAYIPLDKDLKTKGKAAVDVVGSRLGKSGGALTFFILQTILPSVTLVGLTPLLAGISLVILTIWFFAVKRLDQSITAMKSGEQMQAPTKGLKVQVAT